MEDNSMRARRERFERSELLRTSDFYNYKSTPERNEFCRTAKKYNFSADEIKSVQAYVNTMNNADGRESSYREVNSFTNERGLLFGLLGAAFGAGVGCGVSGLVSDANFAKYLSEAVGAMAGFKVLKYWGVKAGVDGFIKKHFE